MDVAGKGAVTGIASHGKAEVTGSAGHLVLGAELVTGCSGPSSCNLQGPNQDVSDLIASVYSNFDESANEVNTPTG